MATRLLTKSDEWLKLAKKRLDLPKVFLYLKYFEDVDVLVVKITKEPSTYSKTSLDHDAIYNYDANDELVSIEILDLYGIFVTA